MCGIAGIIDKRRSTSTETLKQLAVAMATAMSYRGPDDSGAWVSPDGRVTLSHRRLSIIDTSTAGHQPMLWQDGSAIAYNGELYNFREIKSVLESQGERFTSHSDTEVLLAALVKWHKDCLPRLDGMFAFAYYEPQAGSVLLARDIFGEKPLYYLDTPSYFAFASELHALALLPGFDPTISAEAIAAYLAFQYIPAPETIYGAVRKLEPGCWLVVDENGRFHTDRYFKFEASAERCSGRSLDELADELEALLIKTMETRLIADVPLGAFLSGGVDSSTVAAIATKRLNIPLKTYSIGFQGHADSEHHEARAVANHLGTLQHEQVLTANAIELGRHIGKVLDEPNGDTSCLPTFLLSQFARKDVTVAISGDGGDELFGGYSRYFATVDEWIRKQTGELALSKWEAGATYFSSRILVFPDDALAQLMGRVPRALSSTLAAIRRAIDTDPRPLLNVLRELDARTYMPGAVLSKVDRMSMQTSLEVRAPLLGRDVARFAMKLAMDDCYQNGHGKLVLKRVAERYLPAGWMRRPKRGFGLPMDMWGASTLLPELEVLLGDRECRLAEWIPRRRLDAYVKALSSDFHPYRGWSLFILETWLRSHSARPQARHWFW